MTTSKAQIVQQSTSIVELKLLNTAIGSLNILITTLNGLVGERQSAPTQYSLADRIRQLVNAGTPYGNVLMPVALGNSANAAEYVSDATGWVELEFEVQGIAMDYAAAVVLAWSVTVSDQGNCKSAVDGMAGPTGSFNAPTGTFVLNTVSLAAHPGNTFRIAADPVIPFKTYGAGLTADVPGLRLGVRGLRAA